jgi:hypothetical protein
MLANGSAQLLAISILYNIYDSAFNRVEDKNVSHASSAHPVSKQPCKNPDLNEAGSVKGLVVMVTSWLLPCPQATLSRLESVACDGHPEKWPIFFFSRTTSTCIHSASTERSNKGNHGKSWCTLSPIPFFSSQAYPAASRPPEAGNTRSPCSCYLGDAHAYDSGRCCPLQLLTIALEGPWGISQGFVGSMLCLMHQGMHAVRPEGHVASENTFGAFNSWTGVSCCISWSLRACWKPRRMWWTSSQRLVPLPHASEGMKTLLPRQ